MLPEHRNQLLTILAGLDQCCAEADRVIANPVFANLAMRAEELREMLVELSAVVEEHLDRAERDTHA